MLSWASRNPWQFLRLRFSQTNMSCKCLTKLSSGGEDFAEMNTSLQFQPGERRMVVTLTLLNDLLVEDEEIFHVSISVGDPSITVARENASVTILDTDCKTKCYILSAYIHILITTAVDTMSNISYGRSHQVNVQLSIEHYAMLSC